MAEHFLIFDRMIFNIYFDICFEVQVTSTSNHHFFASPTIELRHQSFDDESRPLRRNLLALIL